MADQAGTPTSRRGRLGARPGGEPAGETGRRIPVSPPEVARFPVRSGAKLSSANLREAQDAEMKICLFWSRQKGKLFF